MSLTALPLELHIEIFSNLQPCDIFQARKACKALYLASSERTVWTDALRRICVENTLFEPSFPIASMSVLELQHASMGPHHWISRSRSKERNSDDVLPYLARRRLMLHTVEGQVAEVASLDSLYLVPGGRYLFTFSSDWMAFWDLGSPYSDREPHIIATHSVIFYHFYCIHATPDGLGLRIFIPHPLSGDMGFDSFFMYEIYPESSSPRITPIAHTLVPRLDTHHNTHFYSLSYDRLIFLHGDILTVWDYKANTWARWGVEGDYYQVIITKSTVTLLRTYGVSVWKIPPLLPESSVSMSTNPSIIPSLFELEYPEGHAYHGFLQSPCDWYSGTPQPLYYDFIESPVSTLLLKINRFEVIINPDVSGGTLNLLSTFEVPLKDIHQYSEVTRICQDINVTICIDARKGFLGTHASDIYNQKTPSFSTPLCYNSHIRNNASFCPVAGRAVFSDIDEFLSAGIVILDF